MERPDYELAPWWRRALAFLVDVAIALVIDILVALPFVVGPLGTIIPYGDKLELALGDTFWLIVGILLIAVVLLYRPAFMARYGEHNGQTLGHQLMGIRVIRADRNERITFGLAAIRELVIKDMMFGWIGGMLAHVPTLANYLWPLWDKNNQALHDMICTTLVVKAEGSAPPDPFEEAAAKKRAAEATADGGKTNGASGDAVGLLHEGGQAAGNSSDGQHA